MSEHHTLLTAFLDALRQRLMEAEETLSAIRAGEVDALVVDGPSGQQVYTLESPDEPFRVFVDQMQEGALTLNASGTIVYCNPFFADLVRRPLEQVRGADLLTFIAPEHREAFRKMMGAAVTGTVHGESWLRLDEEDPVPVHVAFNRLPAEHVRMYGVVITDLTERVRAERLDNQRRAAEEAKSARDHFLAVVSHELRTPLNAILGWAQVLRRMGDLPDRAQQGLEIIERNARAQSQLIEDLLDVSRILAGKLRLDLKPTDLGAVLEATVASVQPAAADRGITIETDLPPEPLTVRGDADRLQQIVWNLLSNAVKFSDDNGKVHLALHRVGSCAEITVADCGRGISPGFLPYLFELYQQTEGTTSERSGGLGVGLAIVKQLADLHGGDVHAASEGEGEGASFTVRLPLLEAAPEEAETVTTGPARTALVQDLRLIIVEDEQDAREMLVEVFTDAGAHVTSAATPSEALAHLRNGHFDVLISDIGLPEMDGYELIRRIRDSGRSGRDLPAIAITAYAGREDRHQALIAGYQVHISKPLDQEELIAVVASLVGHRHHA